MSICNLKYSFTPLTFIFILVLALILIVSLIINTSIFLNESTRISMGYQIVNGYLKDAYFITNLISSITVIGLPILTNKSFEFNILQIESRKDVFVSKIISGFIITFILILFISSVFIFIPSVLINIFVIDKQMVLYFVRLFLQLIMLNLVTNIIYEATDNQFSIIFISIIYFINLVNNQNYIEINGFIRIMQFIFPIILTDGTITHFLNGEAYLIIYIVIAILGYCYLYKKKSIKY